MCTCLLVSEARLRARLRVYKHCNGIIQEKLQADVRLLKWTNSSMSWSQQLAVAAAKPPRGRLQRGVLDHPRQPCVPQGEETHLPSRRSSHAHRLVSARTMVLSSAMIGRQCLPLQRSCMLHSMARVPRGAHIVCAAPRTDYRSPSSQTAATELELLERFTVVVPDTLLLQDIESIEAPKAATVSSAVLTGILRNPTGLQEYKVRVLSLMCPPLKPKKS